MNEDGEEIVGLFKKARESLMAAKSLIKEGYFGFSASRSYYTMFYLAEALLLTKDLSYSKHKSVISAFGKYFTKPAIIPKHLHRSLIDAYRLRQIGDYSASVSVDGTRAKDLIEQANKFIEAVGIYLIKKGYKL